MVPCTPDPLPPSRPRRARAGHRAEPVRAPRARPRPRQRSRVIPPGGPIVRLQLRVFDGVDDVTRDTRVRLYPTGQRGEAIKLALRRPGLRGRRAGRALRRPGAPRAPRRRAAASAGSSTCWCRSTPTSSAATCRWSTCATASARCRFVRKTARTARPAGPRSRRRRARRSRRSPRRALLGPDLLLVVPAGTYDIKVTVPSTPPAWISGLEIPDQRTRMKTWPAR